MSIEALPCIICGTSLRNTHDEAQNQPREGVACTTYGNYGSTVWDPVLTGEFLEFNICDPCLIRAGDQNRVYTARTKRPVRVGDLGIVGWYEAPYVPVLWHDGMPGYQDDLVMSDVDELMSYGDKVHLFPDLTEALLRQLEEGLADEEDEEA